ncbi:MAG: hypothetical protein KC583_12815 [Myxococcales bacterium]|nr:hypothetical protein [Myxococcales bacterium]
MRKKAARALGELGDKEALPDLRRAKNRSFFDNLCMDGEIDRAIRKLN